MASENQWAYDLESVIFTKIKASATKKILAIKDAKGNQKYSSVLITNDSISTADAVFPCVYVHEMAGVERGADLVGATINAVQETFQVDVTTNTKQSDAKQVMAVMCDEFKKMQFQITAMPEFDNDSVYRCTMRCRRIIGANDSI